MKIPAAKHRVICHATLCAVAILAICLVALPASGQLQSRDTTARGDTLGRNTSVLNAVVVTTTLNPTEVFFAAQPSMVLDDRRMQRASTNGVADMLRTLPGLAITGVGASHSRPNIRGQQGQRILLLDDGIRLNNSRRQSDFGEIMALADLGALESVEVVRGPSSVLYGTDAIGGVLNLIPMPPVHEGISGSVGYRYSTADAQRKVRGTISGRQGRLGFLVSGSRRSVDQYDAPSGSFGDISLGERTTVFDTGVQDGSIDAVLEYALSGAHIVTARYRNYRSDSAGFGFVNPAVYDPDAPEIRITYPDQQFDKLTLGYDGSMPGGFVDHLGVKIYGQRNERRLDLGIHMLFDPVNLPGAGLTSDNRNHTDLRTVGGRVEAKKIIGERHLLTFGADYFRDNSSGWDTTVTVVTGFGPPMTEISTKPNVPNGNYRSVGLFAQGEFSATDRTTILLGTRYQNVRARTDGAADVEAPVDVTDKTVVGSFNVIQRLNDQLNLVVAVGRAFRSPDLVERLFNGVTPEGGAVQIPNPDLGAETSLNFDVGMRLRNRLISAEVFLFRNQIRDGIRIEATGDSVNSLPVYSNVNVDKLRYSGVELSGDVLLPRGFQLLASYTHLDTKNVGDPDNSVGDTYSNNFVSSLQYTHPGDRIWLSYEIRHNGARKDVMLQDNPVGDVLPAFTVHAVRASGVLFRRGSYTQRVGIAVVNLTDALYAEFPNASFFRPEPRRSLVLSFDAIF